MSLSSTPPLRPESARLDSARPDHLHADLHLTEVERHILASLRQIRFGSLEIVVHDSKIVQVERSEKVRFDVRGKPLSESLS